MDKKEKIIEVYLLSKASYRQLEKSTKYPGERSIIEAHASYQ